jgi:hypothetical protein
MSGPWSNQVVSQVIVGQAPNEQIEMSSSGTASRLQFLSNNALEQAPAELIGEVLNSGPLLVLDVTLFGPEATSTTDRVSINLFSSNEGSSVGATGQLVWTNSSGTPFTIASWGTAGFQFFGGAALPLAVPTGYPLAGGASTAQVVTTLNSLISILIGANIIT